LLARYNDKGTVTLTGVVAAEPDVRSDFIFYKLDVESLEMAGSAGLVGVHGAARVQGPRHPRFHYGDRLQVRGRLETPPLLDGFDYRDYLAHKGIHSQVPNAAIDRLSSGEGAAWKRAMLNLKERAQQTIGRILPEPEAGLLTGIMLGIEGGIPRELMEAFSATGATHVIVISGFTDPRITY
jgi:competence protein ComEC